MLCGDCVVWPRLITSSSTRLYSFITFSRGTISWTANILRLCNYFWASLQIRIFFCIVWLLEDSDANSIFRQEFWIFCICLKCQARDRVLDLVPDQYQKLNLKSFCPIPFSLMPNVISFTSKSRMLLTNLYLIELDPKISLSPKHLLKHFDIR